MRIRTGRFFTLALTFGAMSLGAVAEEAVPGSGVCAPSWTPDLFSPGPPGMDDGVQDFVVFDDGSGEGPALYAAGNFTDAGGVAANRIARWDGSAWTPLGFGLNAPALALAVFDDGSGGGPALYAGGIFTTADGGAASCVAKWDGALWTSLGTGMAAEGTGLDPFVTALAVFDDGNGPALYAGGFFMTAGGASASNVAKWDGASWTPLGTGVNSYVNAFAVFDDGSGSGPGLYVGGIFTIAGGVHANRVAKWDGSSWSGLGAGVAVGSFPFPGVFALTPFDDGLGGGPALYVGGGFGRAGAVPVNSIAKWDGVSWSPLGSGMIGGPVYALDVFDDGVGAGPSLYAGGDFFGAGGVPASRIARWDGLNWSSLGSGLFGSGAIRSVRALKGFENAAETSALYAGGFFDIAGGAPSLNIARWAGCLGVQPPCPGDANGDGVVNFTDLNAVLADFGQSGIGLPGDVNTDGQVDFADLNLVLSDFGLPCPG